MILAALALAISAPAANAPPVANSVESLSSGPYRQEALLLAQTMMPADQYAAMLETALANGIRGELLDDQSLEKQAPRIIGQIVQAAVEAARPFFASDRSDMMLAYARFYSRELTIAEMVELNALFRSPLGQKLIAAKYRHISSPQFAASINTDQPTTESDIAKINRDVVQLMGGGLTEGDKRELVTLAKTPLFAKITALKPQIDRIEAGEANREDPAFDAALSAAVEAVFKRRGITR